MILYGSPTSPFVRRVRVYCLELGVPFEPINVLEDAGQARLRQTTPLWKVPTVVYDGGEIQWDSSSILETLVARHGLGAFRPTVDAVRESNIQHAITGVLDSAINVFYLKRDNIDTSSIPYMVKQDQRVDTALSWLASELHRDSFSPKGGFGLLELTLFATLDWMHFRSVRPVRDNAAFAHFLDAHAGRPSLVATHPSRPFVGVAA